MKRLPLEIYTGTWRGGHIQGIAIDHDRNHIYCSFTTELVKLDLQGNLIGSVKGFTGHLGCLAHHPENGRIYASLEYKNDAIGKGILRHLGIEKKLENAFYVAMFDGEKITRPGMNAETDDVMKTVCLRDVAKDYLAVWEENGKEKKHRFGCSGIDGITFAPAFEGEGLRLLVAYGIYSDLSREDNDHQIILSYRPEELEPYETILTENNIHTNGPDHAEERYFVYTGNTNYGVQNMEYDPATGDIFLAVYKGKKEHFPNYSHFIIDGSKKPYETELRGLGGLRGKLLTLKQTELCENGISGYYFPYGSTGMISLGDGRFYFSKDHGVNGEYASHIRLYRYTGDAKMPFEKLTETENT